jgi:hypothetical protein
MKLVLALSLLVGSLLVAGQVRAEAVSTRLTKEKTEDHLYAFTIKSERVKEAEAGEFFEFRVTVKRKDAKAPRLPNRSGELCVFNGKKFVSSSKLEPTGRDGELSFSFRVAVKYAEKSYFMFSETVETGDGVSGFYYSFYLKDFVEPK